MNDVIMPAGTYYIGDLCYALTDEQWDEVSGGDEGKYTLSDGTEVVIMYTAWGDGAYDSNRNTSHSVDSGSIGCVLQSRMSEQSKQDENLLKEHAAVFVFNESFVVGKRGRGVLQFGDIVIDTDPRDEEEFD